MICACLCAIPTYNTTMVINDIHDWSGVYYNDDVCCNVNLTYSWLIIQIVRDLYS